MPAGLTLLTPTGGRPEAFALSERWFSRQTFRGEVQWLVADDADPPTAMACGQTVVRPEPAWRAGENTQHRNLLALLPLVRFDRIVHWEDDDWYGPGYLEKMARALEGAELVGEAPTRYYNVRFRHWREWGNTKHAALFQTAMRAELLPLLTRICAARQWVDLTLWPSAPARGLLLAPGDSVGIKGMPGRPGQVKSHGRRRILADAPDPALEKLQMWIGSDVEHYRRFTA